jgi:hypothetical protein
MMTGSAYFPISAAHSDTLYTKLLFDSKTLEMETSLYDFSSKAISSNLLKVQCPQLLAFRRRTLSAFGGELNSDHAAKKSSSILQTMNQTKIRIDRPVRTPSHRQLTSCSNSSRRFSLFD